MNQPLPLLLAMLQVGCGQLPSTETVESLAANPVRLKEPRQQCKLDRTKLGDELCNRVAEAMRKRFYGDGEIPYRS